jgi:hypothetical protein
MHLKRCRYITQESKIECVSYYESTQANLPPPPTPPQKKEKVKERVDSHKINEFASDFTRLAARNRINSWITYLLRSGSFNTKQV